MMRLLVRASCATAPPNGQECNDTVTLSLPGPSWLPLAVLAAVVVVVIVVTTIRTRARRR